MILAASTLRNFYFLFFSLHRFVCGAMIFRAYTEEDDASHNHASDMLAEYIVDQ